MNYHILFLNIFSVLYAVNATKWDSSKPSLDMPHYREESSEIISSHKKGHSLKGTKTIVIEKVDSLICQIRVDFDVFMLGEADQQGFCLGGLTVSGHHDTNYVPTICGQNHGQHIYINFFEDYPIQLNFEDYLVSDDWSIRIKQIHCSDAEHKANSDCLQYFTNSFGTVKSFNFRSLEKLDDPPVTYQLANQEYYICIANKSTSYTKINWTRGDDTTNYYFMLTSNAEVIRPSIAGTVEAASFENDCTSISLSNDYVFISNGEFTDLNGTKQNASKFCGAGFHSYVTATLTPFTMRVKTNGEEVAREGSVGFALSYILS